MEIDTNVFPYSPASFLGWALKSGWSPGVLPIGVVYTFQPSVARWAASESSRFQPSTDLTVSNAQMFMTVDDGDPVLVACLNPGGASMVTQLEHLRFLGPTTRFAGIVGTAGSMVSGLNIGDVRVVDAALRSEGISDRYLPAGREVRGDADLVACLQEQIGAGSECAKAWSVDVPYRMTRTDHEQARSDGAEVTEMEIASLFAAARCLDVAAAAVVVVSDVSRADGWESDWSDTGVPLNESVISMISAMRIASAI